MARKKKAKSKVKVDLSNVSGVFEAETEVLVECLECTLEEGETAPYFSMKLGGTDENEGAIMYYNASTAEKALFRLRPVVEAFGIDIPDGPMDLEPEDFVGQFAMCSTYKDRYNGKTTIKPDDFWPPEEGAGGSEQGDFDIDELEDDDLKALGKELKIKGKSVKKIKSALEDIDEDDLLEALEELGLLDKDHDSGSDIDLDQYDTSELKLIGKAAGIKSKAAKKIKSALEEMDDDDVQEAIDEALEEEEEEKSSKRGKKGGKKTTWTGEEINDMNQDELETLVEDMDLDVDLDDFRTLRKKHTAVIDAAEEADILDDD